VRRQCWNKQRVHAHRHLLRNVPSRAVSQARIRISEVGDAGSLILA